MNTNRIDSTVRINLQSVDVISGILKQAVVGVQHFVGQQVQPFPDVYACTSTLQFEKYTSYTAIQNHNWIDGTLLPLHNPDLLLL